MKDGLQIEMFAVGLPLISRTVHPASEPTPGPNVNVNTGLVVGHFGISLPRLPQRRRGPGWGGHDFPA